MVLQAAERYFGERLSGRTVAVISNRDLLEAANREMTGGTLTLHAI